MGKYEEEIFEKTDIFTNHSLDCAEILGKNTIVECQKVYFLTLLISGNILLYFHVKCN